MWLTAIALKAPASAAPPDAGDADAATSVRLSTNWRRVIRPRSKSETSFVIRCSMVFNPRPRLRRRRFAAGRPSLLELVPRHEPSAARPGFHLAVLPDDFAAADGDFRPAGHATARHERMPRRRQLVLIANRSRLL